MQNSVRRKSQLETRLDGNQRYLHPANCTKLPIAETIWNSLAASPPWSLRHDLCREHSLHTTLLLIVTATSNLVNQENISTWE